MQKLSLKEAAVKVSNKADKIIIKEEVKCGGEREALEATAGTTPADYQRRWASTLLPLLSTL